MCVCACEGARWCSRQRHLGAQCRAPAPAQSIGSLSPPPRLGCRQVHFRATGQIDSSAFIFFRLRSGSCSEAGGRSSKMVRDRDGREGRRERASQGWSEMKEGGIKRKRCSWLCSSSMSHFTFPPPPSSLSLTLQHNQHLPPLKSLSRHALTPPPSPKLEISPRTSQWIYYRESKWIFAFILTSPSVSITPFNHTLFIELAL